MSLKRRIRQAVWGATVNRVPPRLFNEAVFTAMMGRRPAIDRPRTFNDRLLHRKFGWTPESAPEFITLSDKLLVKDYVAQELGADWVTPTLWHGRDVTQMPELPFPFVVKARHGSGMNHFVHGPEDLDDLAARVENWLSQTYPRGLAEFWYDHIEPGVLVEPLLDGGNGAVPDDYKYFTFGRQIAFIQLDTDRFGEHRRAFYSADWEKLSVEYNFVVDKRNLPRPASLEQINDAARRLGDPFDFARIDFYNMPDHPVFSEMTFAPAAGLHRWTPDSVDEWMGELWAAAASRRGWDTLPRWADPS